MMTVKEVSKQSGVSIRTLHYYDRIGLLHPTKVTDAGYRQYDGNALERLQQILLFRELEFSLKEIQEILDSDTFDREKALEQQITLLTLKKQRLEHLIDFAREIKKTGVKKMDFTIFDTTKIEAYKKQAKEQWGESAAYQEYEKKHGKRGKEEERMVAEGLMDLFKEFGRMKNCQPKENAVQELVAKLQSYITEHYYECTPQILKGLGQMYADGGEFTQNIDKAGGAGCAQFVYEAIEYFSAQNVRK